MRRRAKPFGCPSVSEPAEGGLPGRFRQCGYALLIVMMAATILLISLTAALPSAYMEGQREREEELIFRGNEYARAIALFRRQFQRYPTSVKELLETNHIRFLRREYPDPMSRKGKWRFIHADANGVVLDSKTLTPRRRPTSLGEQRPSRETREQEEGQPSGFNDANEGRSAFFGREVKGAFIVGVASMSPRKSIRVWNGRTRYDEWEFIGLETNPPAAGAAPGARRPAERQPGQPTPRLPAMPPLTQQPISQHSRD